MADLRGVTSFWLGCIICMSSIHHVWSKTCGQSKCEDKQLANCCTLDGVNCCCYSNGSYCYSSSGVSIPIYGVVLIVLTVIGLIVGGVVGCWWYKRKRNSVPRERF